MKNLKNVPLATARPLGTNLVTKRLEGFAKNLGLKVKIEATAGGLAIKEAGAAYPFAGWFLGETRESAVKGLHWVAELNRIADPKDYESVA